MASGVSAAPTPASHAVRVGMSPGVSVGVVPRMGPGSHGAGQAMAVHPHAHHPHGHQQQPNHAGAPGVPGHSGHGPGQHNANQNRAHQVGPPGHRQGQGQHGHGQHTPHGHAGPSSSAAAAAAAAASGASSPARDRKKSVVWSDKDTEVLISVLLRHRDTGRTPDNGFKPEVWEEASSLLERVPYTGGKKVPETCKSRWQRMQRHFKLARELENVAGMSWDPNEHCLRGSDAAWDAVDKMGEGKTARKIHLPCYEHLALLCPPDPLRPRPRPPRPRISSTSFTSDSSGVVSLSITPNATPTGATNPAGGMLGVVMPDQPPPPLPPAAQSQAQSYAQAQAHAQAHHQAAQAQAQAAQAQQQQQQQQQQQHQQQQPPQLQPPPQDRRGMPNGQLQPMPLNLDGLIWRDGPDDSVDNVDASAFTFPDSTQTQPQTRHTFTLGQPGQPQQQKRLPGYDSAFLASAPEPSAKRLRASASAPTLQPLLYVPNTASHTQHHVSPTSSSHTPSNTPSQASHSVHPSHPSHTPHTAHVVPQTPSHSHPSLPAPTHSSQHPSQTPKHLAQQPIPQTPNQPSVRQINDTSTHLSYYPTYTDPSLASPLYPAPEVRPDASRHARVPSLGHHAARAMANATHAHPTHNPHAHHAHTRSVSGPPSARMNGAAGAGSGNASDDAPPHSHPATAANSPIASSSPVTPMPPMPPLRAPALIASGISAGGPGMLGTAPPPQSQSPGLGTDHNGDASVRSQVERLTDAVQRLQDEDLPDDDLLCVLQEFEDNICAVDVYLALFPSKETLRRRWLVDVVAKRAKRL